MCVALKITSIEILLDFSFSERPFVDQYREYFPEDETKFFFNYTYGDDSKRVFFRSGNARKAAGNLKLIFFSARRIHLKLVTFITLVLQSVFFLITLF